MTEPLAGLTPQAAVRRVRTRLEQAGVPDADYDARELYRLAGGGDPRLDRAPLPPDTARRLEELTRRRAGLEPLQYIAGRWDFLDFTLAVGPGVLCPRPDTEVVCEAALDCLRALGRPDPVVLDLCAGTGCLGLGVRRFWPGARVTCVENSPQALGYLRRNAASALPGSRVGVAEADVLADWGRWAPGSVDLIVSNPPYLTDGEMADLQPETAREPACALAGGPDGLRFYRCLTGPWQTVLRPGGWLVLEIGLPSGRPCWRWAPGAAGRAAAAGRTTAATTGSSCCRDPARREPNSPKNRMKTRGTTTNSCISPPKRL